MRIPNWLKKINDFFINIINFVLVGFIYIFGVGLSWLFYLISKKPRNNGHTYWERPQFKFDDVERQA